MRPSDTDHYREDLPQKVDWEALLQSETSDAASAPLPDEDYESGAVWDKVEVLKMIDRMMCSIYIRATRECEKYFLQYKKSLGTDFETRLRPLVRWRSGRPVEMSWVTKIISERIATSTDLRNYSKKGTAENGVLTRIVYKNNQAIRVREIFKFIPRGKALAYPARMFDKQPNWASIEGHRLESVFHLLRQETVILRELKQKIASLNTLDTKFFDLTTEKNRDKFLNPRDYLTESDAEETQEDSEQITGSLNEEGDELSIEEVTKNDWRNNLK